MVNRKRSESALRLYKGSELEQLNRGRALARVLAPMRASDEEGARMLSASKRVCTVKELAEGSPKADELAGVGDSHLLVRDPMNPGYFLRKPLYDYSETMTGGRFVCDVHEGPVALEPDTLVGWY